MGTIEKLRRRGTPAFRELTGLADFRKRSVFVGAEGTKERVGVDPSEPGMNLVWGNVAGCEKEKSKGWWAWLSKG